MHPQGSCSLIISRDPHPETERKEGMIKKSKRKIFFTQDSYPLRIKQVDYPTIDFHFQLFPSLF